MLGMKLVVGCIMPYMLYGYRLMSHQLTTSTTISAEQIMLIYNDAAHIGGPICFNLALGQFTSLGFVANKAVSHS